MSRIWGIQGQIWRRCQKNLAFKERKRMPKVTLLKFLSDIYISPVIFPGCLFPQLFKDYKIFQGSVYFSHFIAF